MRQSVNALLAQTPLIDGHNDLPAALRKLAGYSVEGLDSERDELHTDLVRLRQGKVGAQFWSAWVSSTLTEVQAVVATLEQVDAVHRLVAAYPESFGLAFTADDVERVFASGRIASLIGVEGGHSIAESLGTLRMLARLGVRYLTLTHNDDTGWADSATGIRQTTGLSAAGLAIVSEMNRIGMIVDLSHTADSTQVDALNQTTAPVIFSHSSTRGMTDHPRNVSDDILSRLAGNGGVVQIAFVPEFVSPSVLHWQRAARAKQLELALDPDARAYYPAAPSPGESSRSARNRNRNNRCATPDVDPVAEAAFARWIDENPQPRARLSEVADHLDYARSVAGIDHVGIGGDYDGTMMLPAGLENVSTYPSLFAELAERNWSNDDLRKLAGQNVLRVMRAVEDAASEPLWPASPANR